MVVLSHRSDPFEVENIPLSKARFLPDGPTKPSDDALDVFWAQAKSTVSGLGDDYSVKWIGIDEPSTYQIFDLIKEGDKRGTFGLPWIFEASGEKLPETGDSMILIGYDGTPTLLVQLTDVIHTPFGGITAEHTSIDGGPVRDLSVWIPLHTDYWNKLLTPYGREVSPDMPVLVLPFKLVYPV